MSSRDVDAFVRRYAAPILQQAGYRQRGRRWMTDGPRGLQAILEIRPEVDADRTGLYLAYGVTTPAHRRWQVSRGLHDEVWPYPESALLHRTLFSPEFARTGVPGLVLPYQWILGDEEHTSRVGAAFSRGLEDEVLPQIAAWFDPECLIRDLTDRPIGAFPAMSPRARAIAIVLMDLEGADARLGQVLDQLPPEDMVRRWIEDELERPSPGGGLSGS